MRSPASVTTTISRASLISCGIDCVEEAWEARHFSLFAPRDFDVSPYFTVVKPPPVDDFDYTQLRWAS